MEPKTFVVIRLDGDYALLQRIDQQEEEPTPVARALLPEDAREGDVLIRTGGIWRVDTEKTEKRRTMVKNRLERLIK